MMPEAPKEGAVWHNDKPNATYDTTDALRTAATEELLGRVSRKKEREKKKKKKKKKKKRNYWGFGEGQGINMFSFCAKNSLLILMQPQITSTCSMRIGSSTSSAKHYTEHL